jgi:hypothetical protein
MHGGASVFSPNSFKAASFAPVSWKGLEQVAPPVSSGGGFVYTARKKKKPEPYTWSDVGGLEFGVQIGSPQILLGRLSPEARRKKDERELLLLLH